MAAVEMLFERYPKLRGRVTFLQIASPSREDVFQYQIIRQELEGAVGRINGRFASSEWTPVRYVSETYSQSRMRTYRLSRVGLITPLRDGMNLVAKEYVAAQTSHDPGALVLSRFAGAAHQMMGGALIVNPYDKVEVCDAVHQALDMTRAERLSAGRRCSYPRYQNGIDFRRNLGTSRFITKQ